jgi:hypothetical protein
MTEKNEDANMQENSGTAASPREELQCRHHAPGAEESRRTLTRSSPLPGSAEPVRGSGQAEEKTAAAPAPDVREEISELEWMRRQTGSKTRSRRQGHKVFRKTELHDRPSSVFSTRPSGKKRRTSRRTSDPEFVVPEEMQEFAESLIGHLNGAAEDLYLQIALVDEQVGELDTMFRKTSRQFEQRIADLEERGRWL